MNKIGAWRAWIGQDRLISNAVNQQGEIIKDYIKSNRDSFKQVQVKNYCGSSQEVIEMLQVASTRPVYYHQGNFYRCATSTRSSDGLPYVAMIAGSELSDLWKSIDFIQNLLDRETDGGRMAPYE